MELLRRHGPRRLRMLLEGRRQTTPALGSNCALCEWKRTCKEQCVKSPCLSLVPELGRAKKEALSGHFDSIDRCSTGTSDRSMSSFSPRIPSMICVSYCVPCSQSISTNSLGGSLLRSHIKLTPSYRTNLDVLTDFYDKKIRINEAQNDKKAEQLRCAIWSLISVPYLLPAIYLVVKTTQFVFAAFHDFVG